MTLGRDGKQASLKPLQVDPNQNDYYTISHHTLTI